MSAAKWIRRNFWIALVMGWFLTGMIGSMVLDLTETFIKAWGVSLWAWPILWPVGCGLALLIDAAPWSEEGRINRRIRAVERETRMLDKRRELERAEAEYRARFDRYISDEPETPTTQYTNALAALERQKARR